MSKRTDLEKKKKDAKNLGGALIFLGIFFLAYDYWKNSTKRQRINIVIWWTIAISFGLSQSYIKLPEDYQFGAIIIQILNMLWGLSNLMERHTGFSFRQGFIKNHTNFPIPNSPRFNIWFVVIFWTLILTFTYLSYNEML